MINVTVAKYQGISVALVRRQESPAIGARTHNRAFGPSGGSPDTLGKPKRIRKADSPQALKGDSAKSGPT